MFVHTSDVQGLDGYSLEALGLIDTPTPEAFDGITRLAKRLFGVPVALISIVQEQYDRQFFLSQQGLAEPWKTRRQTPLTHSFCQHVKQRNTPLVVNSARNHALVKDNLAIDDLGVSAYLGVPIREPSGEPIGALCVIDDQTRVWSDEDLAALADLARCVNDEILLRAALASNREAHERTRRYSGMRESIALAFMTPDLPLEDRFSHLLRAGCDALGMGSARIAKTACGEIEPMFTFAGQSGFRADAVVPLTQAVLSESSHLAIQDLSRTSGAQLCNGVTGSYLGTPLVFGGTLYGVIEFHDIKPRARPWSSEELSIASAVSMFTTAHLGLYGQVADLRNSEALLMRQLSDSLLGS